MTTMAEDTSPQPTEPDPATDNATPDSPPTEGETGESPEALLAQVQQERDELEQRLLRTTADYQNFARRAQQNVTAAEQQALLDVARGMVTVMDHFDRALDVDPARSTAADVLAGLKIVHDELLAALARFGVQRFDAQPGTPFDPVRHEAMLHQAAEGIDPDHIVQQFQPGYQFKEKTVRPAQVSVAQ